MLGVRPCGGWILRLVLAGVGGWAGLGWRSCPGVGSKGKRRLLSLQPQPTWKRASP